MSWIKTVDFVNASGRLKKIYQRIAASGKVDNILIAHSLRPHTLDGHLRLYKSVLHHVENQLDDVTLEGVGVYVSLLNGCNYCVEHHFSGMRRLMDDELANDIFKAMKNDKLAEVLNEETLVLFEYAKKLTLTPSLVSRQDITKMKSAGFDDGEILEINQVIAYFNYANRTVLGLGVELEEN